MSSLFFYLFAGFVITGAMGVIFSRNPVYSVLWLIFAFANSSGLYILLSAEFLAMTLIILYVGAVAVLFMFVVMMLDINISELQSSISSNWPVVLFFIVLFGFDLALVMKLGLKYSMVPSTPPVPSPNNTLAIGSVLYTTYMLPFQIAGTILFIAMIGAIGLTLRKRKNVKKQNAYQQTLRTKKDALELKKVQSKSGIKKIKYG